MTQEDLRHKFHNEQGINWENSQGEPDIDYVVWLEGKVLRAEMYKGKNPTNEEIYELAFSYAPGNKGLVERNALIFGAKWARDYKTH